MDLLAIGIAPGLAIIIFILYRDKFNREPATVLFVSFLFGVLATIPAVVLEQATDYFGLEGIPGKILLAFFGVALVEEAVKFVSLRLYSFTRKSFDEPLDGIVHGVMVGMGFATLENVLYVWQHGAGTGWLRMFTAVPGHAAFGVIMGYYVGKAKFNYNNRFWLLLTGLLLATFFHGLYDACLFLTTEVDPNTAAILALAALTTDLFAVLLAARLIRQHRAISVKLYKSSPVYSVRTGTIEDTLLIRTLAKQIWPQTYEKILKPAQVRYMMDLLYSVPALHSQMAAGQQFDLLYNNGVPVGFTAYNVVEPGTVKLQKIYVLLNQQGRGAGMFLINYVMRLAAAKGAERILLNVNKANKAKGFYEKLGFAVYKEEVTDIGGGYVMDDYVMAKRITDDADVKTLAQMNTPF